METKDTQQSSYSLFKQSSEIEILISAAIVFAAFKLYDLVPNFLVQLINDNISNQSAVLFAIAIIALFLGALLPLSIILHFILRFYWLSLVGLKTSYENPKWEKVNFADKFKEKYKKSIDLDKHIAKVDRICSSIFAFSFLAVAVFCFTSIAVIALLRLFIYLVDNLFENTWFQEVFIGIGVLLILILILGFIDFVTLGALKRIKKKWFIKFYFPVSQFLSIITFGFLYRGLYYTFITNVPKSLTAFLLPFYLLIAIVLLNLGYYESRLFEEDITGVKMGEHAILSSYYSENFNENNVIQGPFIPSYLIKGNSLKFSYALTEEIDDKLIENCDSVYALNERGLHWRKWIRFPFNERDLPENFDFDKNAENALNCFSNHLKIVIDDSIYSNQTFKFLQLQKPEKIVLSTMIDISHLAPGDHVLSMQLQKPIGTAGFKLPFYKEP